MAYGVIFILPAPRGYEEANKKYVQAIFYLQETHIKYDDIGWVKGDGRGHIQQILMKRKQEWLY